jgi:hypothetical protein
VALEPLKEILWKWLLRYLITEMRFETSERPSSWRLPWGYLLQLWDGPDNNAHLWGLFQVQPDGTTGKTLPFTLPTARTLSTMWPEWTLGNWLPLFVSAR